LKAAGVATGIYYPVPLHLQRAFKDLGYQAGDFPVAEQACQEAFAIPCYPELTLKQQQEIVRILGSAL
ncbi:MAG: DegT/DnrJ/EryC1/StrS family aminotransferase, partial [Desulfitobacteriaceae bacterium]